MKRLQRRNAECSTQFDVKIVNTALKLWTILRKLELAALKIIEVTRDLQHVFTNCFQKKSCFPLNKGGAQCIFCEKKRF